MFKSNFKNCCGIDDIKKIVVYPSLVIWCKMEKPFAIYRKRGDSGATLPNESNWTVENDGFYHWYDNGTNELCSECQHIGREKQKKLV